MAPIINYWAVLVAAVVNMVVGFLWYGPLFGKTWLKLVGIPHDEAVKMASSKGMSKRYFIAFVGAFLIALTLDHWIIFAGAYLNISGAWTGLNAAFWIWLGFFAPVTATAWLWEGKPAKLWCFNASYYLVVLGIMGAILAAWM